MKVVQVFLKGWEQFFFRERPTHHLAIFRILWGGLVFLNILFELGNVSDFYGPEAILSLEVVKARLTNFHFSLFHLLPHSLASAYGIYFFTLISLLMVTIGQFTRFFLFTSFLGLISLHMRNIWIISSADVLVRCIFFILVWSPCFNVLSLDAYWAKKKGRPLPLMAPSWTWRLIQIQVAVLYLWTAIAKVKGGGWIDGSAVYYATRLETMRNFTLPWVLDNMVMLKFSTWMTLAIEFALGTLIWLKAFRTPVLILGILLHLGIEFTMAIPFFEWMMMILLLNFYTPEEYVVFYERMKSFFSKSKITEGLNDDSLV